MRWVTAEAAGNERAGAEDEACVCVLEPGTTLLSLLTGASGALAEAAARALAGCGSIMLDAAGFLAPHPIPPSVRDLVVLEQHFAKSRVASQRTSEQERDSACNEQPDFSFSNPAAVSGPGDAVADPSGCTQFDDEHWDRLSGRERNSAMTADTIGQHNIAGTFETATHKVVVGWVPAWSPGRGRYATPEDSR